MEYQIFDYTHCITPKGVTSLQGSSPRHCARKTATPFEEISQRWQAVGNCVRFEPPSPKKNALPLDQLAGCSGISNHKALANGDVLKRNAPLTTRIGRLLKGAKHLASSGIVYNS